MHLKHEKCSRNTIWHLGRKKNKKGGFLPIYASLAKPLLVFATHALCVEILQGHKVKSSE